MIVTFFLNQSTISGIAFIASIVFSISSSSSQPSISAPLFITSREQPAAKLKVLNFFLTDLTYKSCTLLEGLIKATAPIKPVNSSTA